MKQIDFLKLDVGEIGADILLQMFDEDNIYPNCLSIRFSMQDFANSDQCTKEELERKYTSIILKVIEKESSSWFCDIWTSRLFNMFI